MSRVGNARSRFRPASRHREGRRRRGEGPEGHSSRSSRRRSRSRSTTRGRRFSAPTTRRRAGPCTGWRARSSPTWCTGRDRGLHEGARDPGRRLPRRREGQEAEPPARLLAPGGDAGAGGPRSRSRRTRIKIEGIDRSVVGQFAADVRKARCGRRSPTRARASATWTSRSAARSARPAPWARSGNDEMKRKDPQRRSERSRLAASVRVARRLERSDRPRLTVFRTAKHIYAQLDRSRQGKTPRRLHARKAVRAGRLAATGNVEAAKRSARRSRSWRSRSRSKRSSSTGTASSTTAA